MEPDKILVLNIGPLEHMRANLREILERSTGLKVKVEQRSLLETLSGGFECGQISNAITHFRPRVIFLVGVGNNFEQVNAALASIRAESMDIPLFAVLDADAPEEIMGLLQNGVEDFITPPLKPVDILPRLWRTLERTRPENPLSQALKAKLGLQQFVGECEPFLAAIKQIPLIARSDANVLITGETGTGKELSARAVHYLSGRSSQPFVPLNCGAIPLELVENELFGHQRGAFTSASGAQPGLIHEATGGTLFLDEIDSMPPFAQVKLLRFLQDREYRPLGAAKMIHADVRVVAATNADVEEAVKAGKLRQDLYYRLSTITLQLPPLRERRDDIPLLARHFVAAIASRLAVRPKDISAGAIQKLLLHDWPGNVRELEHVMERAVALSERMEIQKAEIDLPVSRQIADLESFQRSKAKVVAEFETSFVRRLLEGHQGNITRAALSAHKDRRLFRQLIRKHQIDVDQFKPASQAQK